jgi:GTP pyrophosphokinase
MYQSIHTTVLGTKGTPVEVQIRTWEMHHVAEYGIAAHWAYKEASNKGTKQVVTVKEDKLSWLRETLEWQKETENPDEFLKTLKTELFEDEVYVFTPKGRIVVLPRHATPIDFAYEIHEAIGNKMVGCKINGKMMPIITHLHNGDICEIITSEQNKGPSRDWLKFVQSSGAKNKINKWFKNAERNVNIERGRDALEREIKKLSIKPVDILKDEWIDLVLQRYQFGSIDDMYASIGFGGLSVNKVVARLLEQYDKEHESEDFEQKIEEMVNSKPTKVKPSKSGVIVKGIDNCLVKLSKCCNPLPGDDIVGYITKGRGVSIHRTNCPNVKDLINDAGRIIDVYWYDDVKGSYSVNIEIFANDRNDLLKDIIKQVDNVKAHLTGVNAKTNREGVGVINITVELDNKDNLNKLLNSLRNVESVYDVQRKRG